MKYIDYTLDAGQEWQRMIMIKDYRTRRLRMPTQSSASMQAPDGAIVPIATSITHEGGILMCLPITDTADLTAGEYAFDVVANPRGNSETVAQGTITISTIERITPLTGSFDMLISYRQGTDLRQNYTWTDADGATLLTQDARLMAVDDQDVVVLDLAWFATPPDEAAIALLDPEKRGYLAPKTDYSLELHISELAVIAPGDYSFDLKVQEATNGDWETLSNGTIRVIKSITDQQAP